MSICLTLIGSLPLVFYFPQKFAHFSQIWMVIRRTGNECVNECSFIIQKIIMKEIEQRLERKGGGGEIEKMDGLINELINY